MFKGAKESYTCLGKVEAIDDWFVVGGWACWVDVEFEDWFEFVWLLFIDCGVDCVFVFVVCVITESILAKLADIVKSAMGFGVFITGGAGAGLTGGLVGVGGGGLDKVWLKEAVADPAAVFEATAAVWAFWYVVLVVILGGLVKV